MSLGSIRALSPEVLFRSSAANAATAEMSLYRMRRKAYLSGFYETAVEFKGILVFLYS
jgi:hypothetical protein